MNILILLAMAGMATAILISVHLLHRRRSRSHAQVSITTSLDGSHTLLALIGHIQQHRGMSSALLSGDQNFRTRLDSKAREIEALLPKLGTMAKFETAQAFPCFTSNDLNLFKFHWDELRNKLEQLSIEQSITQHSVLIEELLEWLSAVGEARLSPAKNNPEHLALVRNYASRLPALTECLGRARAMGSSVAAKKSCSAVARVRLMFLVSRSETLLSQAQNSSGHSQYATQAAAAIQEMLTVVRSDLLQSAGITVSAQTYFQTATRAIDLVFAWIDSCGRDMTHDIDTTLTSLSTK